MAIPQLSQQATPWLPSRRKARIYLPLLALLYIVALSAASLVVIGQAINGEPFHRFEPSECLLQVGAGMTLLTLWAHVAVGVRVGVRTSRLPGWFAVAFFWALAMGLFLWLSPTGYVNDIASAAEQGLLR